MNQAVADRLENNVDFTPIQVAGRYKIPVIAPEAYVEKQWVPFNTAASIKNAEGLGIHFFIHDYLFQRLWYARNKYTSMFKRYGTAMTPDFSMYTDFPVVVQIWNHYRKHLIGAWLQDIGVTVYPTICWSDRKSFEWCFDGEPKNSTVCVSSVGTQKHKESQKLFLEGYDKMLDTLTPKTILFYGKIPKECDGNIVSIEPFYKAIKERSRKNET